MYARLASILEAKCTLYFLVKIKDIAVHIFVVNAVSLDVFNQITEIINDCDIDTRT